MLLGHWNLSNVVIEAKERHDIFPTIKRQISRTFSPEFIYQLGVSTAIASATLLYIVKTVMPFYDSHIDASFVLAIHHIEKFFITTTSKAKEISFIHLTLTKYYYYLADILSTIAVSYFVNKSSYEFEIYPKSLSAFPPSRTNKILSYFPLIFPYHAIALEFISIEYQAIKLQRTITNLSNEMAKVSPEREDLQDWNNFKSLQKKLTENNRNSLSLKRIITFTFLLNLVIEGLPQLLVTSSLLVGEFSNSNGFGQLRHLFQNVLQEYLGLPGDASFIVMLFLQVGKINLGFISVLSLQACGVDIGIIGGVIKFFAVLPLIIGKMVLLTLQFYQTPFIFGIITILEILLGYSFCKLTQREVYFLKDVLPNLASPALNAMGNPVNTYFSENNVKKPFQWSLKWDGVQNIVILHIASLLFIYLPVYQIVRLPLFMPPRRRESVEGALNFAIVGYIFALVPFLLLRTIYYRFGRRWGLLENSRND